MAAFQTCDRSQLVGRRAKVHRSRHAGGYGFKNIAPSFLETSTSVAQLATVSDFHILDTPGVSDEANGGATYPASARTGQRQNGPLRAATIGAPMTPGVAVS